MPSHPAQRAIEFQVHPGLGAIAAEEIAELFPSAPVLLTSPSTIRVEVGAAHVGVGARTVIAAFVERLFPFRRPSGLSGHDALREVSHDVRLAGGGSATASFRVTAAGADSPAFRQWIEGLEAETGMAHDPLGGGVLIRVVRARPTGWRVLVRLTTRPLSARPWRVPGFAGALDASVAAAMVRASRPSPGTVFVDPTCGSGTILVEYLMQVADGTAIGCDIATSSLGAAAANVAAAGVTAELVQADAEQLPLKAASADVICANPPWGHRFGSGDLNDRLYPGLLAEARRIGAPSSRLVVLTHDIRRFDAALRHQRHWTVDARHQISLRGHHPVLWVLTPPRPHLSRTPNSDTRPG